MQYERLRALIDAAEDDGTFTETQAIDKLFCGKPVSKARAQITALSRGVRQASERLAATDTTPVRLLIEIDRSRGVPPNQQRVRFEGTPDPDTLREEPLLDTAKLTGGVTPSRFIRTMADLEWPPGRPGPADMDHRREDHEERERLSPLLVIHDESPNARSLIEKLRGHLAPGLESRTQRLEVVDLMEPIPGVPPLGVARAYGRGMVLWLMTARLKEAFSGEPNTKVPRPSDLPEFDRAVAEVEKTDQRDELWTHFDHPPFPQGGLPYSARVGASRKSDYTRELADFLRRISKPGSSRPHDGSAEEDPLGDVTALDDLPRQALTRSVAGRRQRFVSLKGSPSPLINETDPAPLSSGPSGQPVDVLDALAEWASEEHPSNDVDGAPFRQYGLLLGDLGAGKTTMSALLARRILDLRRDWSGEGREPRIPIYLDLRNVGSGFAATATELAPIIDRILAGSRGHAPSFSGEDVLTIVRQGRALLIVDGLDEVIVRLPEDEGQRFARLWWGALGSEEHQSRLARRSQLLMTCRTHYFRRTFDEADFFRSQDRDDIEREQYLALVLRPFESEQIREYLSVNPPSVGPSEAWDIIESLHNLPELARRPVNLALITSQIDAIADRRESAAPVTSATVYGAVVARWLGRDRGKHSLTREHKILLMEELAAVMAREGSTSWTVDAAEDWLLMHIGQTKLRYHYKKIPEGILKEDFRTATFLTRTRGDDEFRFAHTSLQEYFTARYLARALDGSDPAPEWALPRPSIETLDFLGAMLLEEKGETRTRKLRGLRTISESYHPLASELALVFALYAESSGYPRQSLVNVDLREASLAGQTFAGGDSLLDLRGARLDQADLRDSRFRRCLLDGASFRGANLLRSQVLDASFDGVSFDHANLTGAILRQVSVLDSTWENAVFRGTQVISCPTFPRKAQGFDGFVTPCGDASPRSTRGQTKPERPLEVYLGHPGGVRAVAFSPEGAVLAVGSNDGTVRLWDPVTGQNTAAFKGHGSGIRSVAFGTVGGKTLLASASDDGTVRLWDPTTGRQTTNPLQGHTGPASSVAFGTVKDTTLLASAGDDGAVRLWDPTTGEQTTNTLQGHTDWVSSVAFGTVKGKTLLASASTDGTVRLWDPITGHQTTNPLLGHSSPVRSIAFGTVGNRVLLASADDDGTVRLWDPTTGHEATNPLPRHTSPVRSIAFGTVNGKTLLASGSSDGTVRLWNCATGDQAANPLHGHTSPVRSVVFGTVDGTVLLASASSNGTVRLWNPTTGTQVTNPLQGHTSGVRSVVFGTVNSETLLASGSTDGTVRLWNPTTGTQVTNPLQGHTSGVRSVVFGTVNGQPLLASGSTDGTVRLWNPTTGHQVTSPLQGHTDWVTSLAFGTVDEEPLLASASSDGTVRLWNPTTGDQVADTIEGHTSGVRSVVFGTVDGRTLLATGSFDRLVRLWNPTSGHQVCGPLQGHTSWVWSVAFGTVAGIPLLASASDDCTVRLWDPTTGQQAHEPLLGHTDWVRSVAFGTVGGHALLASASFDGTVRLWDPTTGHAVSDPLQGHTSGVNSVAFGTVAGQTLLASASFDGTVRLWDPTTFRPLHVIALLPGNEYAAWGSTGPLLHATSEAWQYLGWPIAGTDGGYVRRAPAEMCGPLPPA